MKKIKVNIKCSEVVQYDQIVEMSEEDFKRLQEAEYDDIAWNNPEYALIEKYIDRNEVFGNEGEWKYFQVIKEKVIKKKK